MNFDWILTLIAGLGFFLYGMKIMGDGLEKAAGDRMSKIIDNLTGSLLKGVLVGTAVTALIQSSSATTVMVVGFINAGIMSLQQAVGVIMGANIGTTITAVLISLEDINSSLWILDFVKPSNLAPIAIAVGIVFLMFIKKRKYNNIGEILAGFGFLFVGMDMMSSAMDFLRDSVVFQNLMIQLQNPILGVLVGAGITAIIQSSSASVGILQAASATGFIKFSGAVSIVLGQNIGTCITAILSSIGANKTAKRAAIIHLLFNIIGSIIFIIVLYGFGIGKFIPVWTDNATKTNIAGFHISFNVINTILLLPFSNQLVFLANKILPSKDNDVAGSALEARLLSTPALALSQTTKELVKMMNLAADSVKIGYDILNDAAAKSLDELEEIENSIDVYESNITQYLVKIVDEPINEEENNLISSLFHVITDVERIGDHAFNISSSLNEMKQKGLDFSSQAKIELNKMYEAVNKLVSMTLKAYEMQDARLAADIQPLEDVIDYLNEHLKNSHLERLAKHECGFTTGVFFLDIVGNLERIADHCSNIGLAVEQVKSKNTEAFDPHAYLKHLHENKTEEYTNVYDKYISKYAK
ncbi:MAG: Na/Pi cotransporter family protein [Clostridia bacterium]|nr:Na/Pi cotransporter family protein [Clostridia bacterium]